MLSAGRFDYPKSVILVIVCLLVSLRPSKKKIDVSRPEFFQKGGGRFLLFTIFTISYLLEYYES